MTNLDSYPLPDPAVSQCWQWHQPDGTVVDICWANLMNGWLAENRCFPPEQVEFVGGRFYPLF